MLVSNSDGLAREGLLGAILLIDMVADAFVLVERDVGGNEGKEVEMFDKKS